MIADLSRLAEHQSAWDALCGELRGRGFYGARWLADRSDCAALRRFAEWIVVFRGQLLAHALTSKVVEVASARIDVESLRARIEALQDAVAVCSVVFRALIGLLCVDGTTKTTPFLTLVAQIEQWQ